MQNTIDRSQIGRAIHFEAEMRRADAPSPERRREIHRRLVDPPTHLSRCSATRVRSKQTGIKPDGLHQVADTDMDVQALHDTGAFGRFALGGWHEVPGAHFSGAPPQQFSVRKASSAFIV